MTNTMSLTPTDLAGYPGAPFTQPEVDAAVAVVRNAARWHIAPVVTETVTMDVECRERTLRLPTRNLVSVTEVRDTDTDDVIEDTLYRVSLPTADIRLKLGFWPAGFGRVEVDISHGYGSLPLDLLPVLAGVGVASRQDQSATKYVAGPFTVLYGPEDPATRTANPLSNAAVLERYLVWDSGL